MAWTQSDLDALDKAIGSGVTEVRYNDRTVRYRSMDELMRAREIMAKELGIAQKPRRVFPVFSRGHE